MALLLVDLPDELIRRLERTVPARQRSGFVQRLIEEALTHDADEDQLYRIALAVERDEALNAEMAEWERATVGDGLDGRS
jgi:metal-responsive CopG/Arc/MetJ family transcriptional regulator